MRSIWSQRFVAPPRGGCIPSAPVGRPTVSHHRVARFASRASPEDLFVLDFDGVLCDSQVEVSSAGVACARALWPTCFADIDDATLMKGTAQVRPRLVKGYESMLMARLLAEAWNAGDAEGMIEKILNVEDWADTTRGMVYDTLAHFGADEDDLMGKFEAWRMDRIQGRFEDWLEMNPLYDGVKDALMRDCQSPFYIASSKAGSRLIPLLNNVLGMDVNEESPRVFHSLIPPNELKLEVLETVLQRPMCQDGSTQLHFVDDRFETVEYIYKNASEEVLSRYNIYLAGWGYCTDEEKSVAAKDLGVRVLDLDEFLELLRFGIIMKVNDGCQDTDEEALAQVYQKREDA